MQIRGATTEDCPGLARVQVENNPSAHTGIFFAEALGAFSVEEQEANWRTWVEEHPDDILYVAEADKGGIIGYALARTGETGVSDYDGELLALHVREKNQHLGIGRLLLWTAGKELRRAGSRAMMLWIFEASPICAFYEHLGAIRLEAARELNGQPPQVAYGWPEIERVWTRPAEE